MPEVIDKGGINLEKVDASGLSLEKHLTKGFCYFFITLPIFVGDFVAYDCMIVCLRGRVG
jgi:hypothetical protein